MKSTRKYDVYFFVSFLLGPSGPLQSSRFYRFAHWALRSGTFVRLLLPCRAIPLVRAALVMDVA